MADIAGSSRLWNHETDLMSRALKRHDEIATSAVVDTGGTIFKHTGDGFIAEFTNTDSALDAMRRYQHALSSEPWPDPVAIRSRVAIHAGVTEERDGDRFGPAINHLARITDLVEPTHIVVTEPALEVLEADVGYHPLQALGAYRVRDLPEPLSLHSLGLASAVGPALTLDAGVGLPRFATPIVGRQDELRQLDERLATARLVTIVGFGGMGKTRLAVEAAHRRSRGDARPAFFIDLALSADPLAVIADGIGLSVAKLDEGHSPFETMAKHLGSTPSLLVVDNCEHVIDEIAEIVAGLLDAAPDVQILATSREPLELDHEIVHPLAPMATQDARDLFANRAGAAAVDLPDDAAIDALVESVDALPLGIELVVARLRSMPAADLVAALSDDLDALRSRRRSRQPDAEARAQRHATLRSLVAWSVDLLDVAERRLLARLAAFPAPVERTIAGRLAPAGDADLIEELEAKSLVYRDQSGRYRMLESVRHYCESETEADPDQRDDVDDALVDWAVVAAPAVRSAAGLVFDQQRTRELAERSPNFRAALSAATRRGRGDDQGGIVTGLWQLVVDVRSRRWFDQAVLDALAVTTDVELRAILVRLAFQGQVGEAADLARQAELVAMLDEVDPGRVSPVRAVLHINDSVTEIITNHVFGQDLDPVRARLDDEIRRCVATDHLLDAAAGNLYVAFSHLLDRDTTDGRRRAIDAGDAARRINFQPLVGLADAAVAVADLWEGETARARERASAAAGLAVDARWESSVRAVEAVALAAAGAAEQAHAAVDSLIDLALELDNPFVTFDAAIGLAACDLARGDRESADAAVEHTSIGRTPLALALLHETERVLGRTPSVDRFIDVVDPDAFRARSDNTARYLAGRRGR